MARPLRIDYPGAWHHLMNRGARHQMIFLCEEDRYDFLDLLATMHERFGIEFNAYCLMGTHYHLLAFDPEGELSRAMHYLDSVYAQRFNRRNSFDGPLFKGRFTSKLIDTDGYRDLAARYIHRNPLEANLTSRLISYKWSSYPIFMDPSRQMPPWLFRDALDAGGLHTPSQLQRSTEGPLPGVELEAFQSSDAIIGSDAFIEAALKISSDNHETRGQYRATMPATPVGKMDKIVAHEFKIEPSALYVTHRGLPNVGRLIAVGLAQQICRQSLSEIAGRYGYSTPKSAGSAVARFKKRLGDEAFAIEAGRIASLCEKGESEARPGREEGRK